ncbi:hypothetical protein BDW22DRAFT_1382462 [Trametopsis cervina]|nr:hypothetical protein BDW22DRAFT_1382462 [Trametopsis cervina]
MAIETVSPPSTVSTRLQYATAPLDGEKNWSHINLDPASGQRVRNWDEETHGVKVEDVRGQEHAFTLDTAGFQFFNDRPAGLAYEKFAEDAEVESVYYKSSIEFVKEVTGASRVEVFDHTIRRRRPGIIDDSPTKRQPVSLVHVDQTAASATARVHRHLPASDVPSLLSHRFQLLNLWRPLGHEAYDWPLAVCDFRSLDVHRDLLPTTLIYPEGMPNGETLSVRYNPGHKWKYLRGMRPDEVLLFKCFDSKNDGRAVLAPHTAFEDVTKPEGVPFRESIELRMLVFYDE